MKTNIQIHSYTKTLKRGENRSHNKWLKHVMHDSMCVCVCNIEKRNDRPITIGSNTNVE